MGPGLYFWEQNPLRALEYAKDSASGKQFNKVRIKVPFVLGSSIQLGKCLNLLEPESLFTLKKAYKGLEQIVKEAGKDLPVNDGPKRILDCAVIKFVHRAIIDSGFQPYDTIRAAFQEGNEIYPSAPFTTQSHLQICVCNLEMIKGYFLPRPLEKYNPYLHDSQ